MAIQKLAQEDPTFRVNTDPETGPDDSLGDGRAAPGNHRGPHDARIRRGRQRGQAAGGLPRDHPQACAKPKAGTCKQTGGRGQYGVREDPHRAAAGRAAGSSSSTKSSAGACPRNSSGPTEAGIKEALEGGILAGYPMSDVKVTLYDGSYHDVDSSEMAFKIAGSMAIKEAAAEGQAGAARAHHGGGSGGARGVHGRRDRRPEFPPRAHRGHGAAGHHADHQVHGAAFGNVRLRHGIALPDAGPRQFHHALSASTKKCRRRSPRRSSSKVQGKITR